MSHHGRFCWYDLMTNDPAGSRTFYGALLGWRAEAPEGVPTGYEVLHAGDHPVGGLVPLDPSEDMPTHWIPYLAVDDLEEACAETEAAGGGVCIAPMDVGPGRMAIVNDPQGGTFTLWQTKVPPHAEAPAGTPGTFCWHECLSSDADGGAAFYARIFGWDVDEMDMETDGFKVHYHVFLRDGVHHSGIMDLPPEALEQGAATHWLGYVSVADVDAASARAASLGAAVLCPCTDIPDTGRFCVIQDPQGGVLSLFQAPAADGKDAS